MTKKHFFIPTLILCFSLLFTACIKKEPLPPPAESSAVQSSASQPVVQQDLQFDHSMELRYAQNFSVDYYKGGYAMLSITDVGKYLVVPEGKPVPDAVEKDTVILQQPIDNIYLVATSAMNLFCSLDALDTISLSGTEADGWYIAPAKEAMLSGKIAYAGKYSAPDYEKIVAQKCDLAIESSMIYHTPDVKEKLEQFQIPVLVDRSSYENHPLGRAEWIKLYGVLLGKEDFAAQLMDAQTAKLASVTSDTASGKTVAFFYISSSGYANVRKADDYIAKMIALAGGNYVFNNLDGEDARSTVNLQMEEFYALAKDADILIYNSAIDGELNSLDALMAKSPLFKDFKAVKTGNVWSITKNLFQETLSLGDMIADFHTVFSAEDPPKELTYLYQLQ